MNIKKIIITGLFFILSGIILGAFGAHYLESTGMKDAQIKSFSTGTTYLFYNGLGLLAIASLSNKFDFQINTQYRFILWGTILFSFSIFGFVCLSQTDVVIHKIWRLITPLGGFLMILGWASLLIKYIRTSNI